jgi:hypothetical protein
MDLTDFLLARIAEDQERAEFVMRQQEGGWVDPEPWRLSWHDEYDLLCIAPSRAMTEARIRDKMVTDHTPWHVCAESTGRPPMSGEPRFPCTTLLLLAQPYADHPDYRKEWSR